MIIHSSQSIFIAEYLHRLTVLCSNPLFILLQINTFIKLMSFLSSPDLHCFAIFSSCRYCDAYDFSYLFDMVKSFKPLLIVISSNSGYTPPAIGGFHFQGVDRYV
jgi:hypothetical protein